MEFSEIGEKFEGLNADQVYNLAKFGKESLGINGSVTLARDVYKRQTVASRSGFLFLEPLFMPSTGFFIANICLLYTSRCV